jgi:hypothetical protein
MLAVGKRNRQDAVAGAAAMDRLRRGAKSLRSFAHAERSASVFEQLGSCTDAASPRRGKWIARRVEHSRISESTGQTADGVRTAERFPLYVLGQTVRQVLDQGMKSLCERTRHRAAQIGTRSQTRRHRHLHEYCYFEYAYTL